MAGKGALRPMAINVLFITRKWPPAVGGMETYCVELVKTLKARTELTLEALPGRANGDPPSTLSILGFGVKTALKLLTRPARYDVVHSADMAAWPLAMVARLRSRGAKIVLSAHGTDVAFASRKGLAPALYRAYLRLGARSLRHTAVIANSRATAALLKTHGFTAPEIVPLASPLTAQAAPESAPARYVLYVGRLINRKGCAWFVRNVLPRLAEDIRLKVAGTIVDESEREALDHPRVDYLGPVFGDELSTLRRDAIAVLVPNIAAEGVAGFEGFGLTAVEGAAAGGVVLAAEIDGVADAVIDGETGFLLPTEKPEAWARKIAEIDAWDLQRRCRFIDGALCAVRRRYSWERVTAETLAVYCESRADGVSALAPAS